MPSLDALIQRLTTVVANLGLIEWLCIFALLLGGGLFLASRLNGWHTLAKHYGTQQRYQGAWISQPDDSGKEAGGLSVTLNSGESENAIKLGADRDGVYLAMSLGFRPFHPPLFIPWNDIKAVWVAGAPWLKTRNLLRITFRDCPHIPLEVDRHVANRLEEHAEGRWKIPAAD